MRNNVLTKIDFRRCKSHALAAFIIFFILICLYKSATVNNQGTMVDLPDGWKVIRPPHDISSIVEQGDTIWVGGFDGVFSINKLSFQQEPLKSEIPLKNVKALAIDSRNNLWIGHEGGLSKKDEKSVINYTADTGLPDNRVNALAVDLKGNLWVGTWKGAAVISPDGIRTITTKDGLLNNMVNVILCDRNGNMWFGSYVAPKGGLCCNVNGQWQYFSTENGLPHNNVNSLFEDYNGNVWAATGFAERGGACVFEYRDNFPRIKKVITKKDGLVGEKVRSVYQDNMKKMWLGSEYQGLTIFPKNKLIGEADTQNAPLKVLTTNNGLSDNEVKCMMQDKEGNLWLGTRDGVTYISKNHLPGV